MSYRDEIPRATSQPSTPEDAAEAHITNALSRLLRQHQGGIVRTRNSDHGQALIIEPPDPKPDEHVPLSPIRQHQFGDVASLVAYANKYTDAEKGAIFYDDQGAALVLDENPDRGEFSIHKLVWPATNEWKAWGNIEGRELTHADVRELLLYQKHTLVNSQDVHQAALAFKASAEIEQTELEDGRGGAEYALMVKVGTKGSEKYTFPTEIQVILPVFFDDLDGFAAKKVGHAPFIVVLNFDVTIRQKMGQQGRVETYFRFSCPTMLSSWRARIDQALKDAKVDLPDDFQVFRGGHCTHDRTLGAEKVIEGRSSPLVNL